jgi:glycosyltransferase involved in cell wall biosynthesis
VFRIPIGIDLEHFPPVTEETRSASREVLGLPASAFVVGSFQKDGVGWGEGLEPKLVKGPDVLVAALERLRRAAPELHVLLTGPARGYVKHELGRLGIPYRHTFATSRDELARAYHALDVYLVSSRQEGGPKGVLEAMASGVPLVSTRVGQAQELVADLRNGWLVDVDDPEALAARAAQVRGGVSPELLVSARATAERFSLATLDPLWESLLSGFVQHGVA